MIWEVMVLFGVLIACLAIGLPIFLAMGLSCAAYIIAFWPKVPMMIVSQGFVQGLDNHHFAAILFYFVAGEIINVGGTSRRLLRFTRALLGHIKGGLSHINIIASMLFAGVSGSAVADASAIGSIMIPAMKKDGYSPAYSAAVTAASSTIGPVIPPSIPLVIFGLASMTSVGKLFLGGVIPGLLMGAFLLIASYIISVRRNFPSTEWRGWRNLLKTAADSFLALLIPLIVVIGIVGGFATVSEVGAIAVAYAVIVSLFIYRELSIKQLGKSLCKAGLDSCKVLIIISLAGLFVWIIGNMGAAELLSQWILATTSNPIYVLALIALALLIAGMVLEPVILFVVVVPLLIPTASAVGIDLVQLGIVAVLATLMGLITPPVGLLIYLTAAQADTDAHRVIIEMLPFIAALLVLLILLIVFPSLSTWLPGVLMG